jgi:hypothetical protein
MTNPVASDELRDLLLKAQRGLDVPQHKLTDVVFCRASASIGKDFVDAALDLLARLEQAEARPEPDDLTEDELRGRAKSMFLKNGWKTGDRLSVHSVVELMTAFGMDVQKSPAPTCGHPDCGCDFDAICNSALPKATPVTEGMVETAEPVTLAECPIGLFMYRDELCLKTEYGNNEGRIDAYIVSSGEFFWGDAPQTIASQRKQLVRPVALQQKGKA